MFVGFDPETGRRVDRSMTVRGSRVEAERELAAMVASVTAAKTVGGRSPVGELLEAWFVVAAQGWSPTTIRQTRSVIDCYLRPSFVGVTVAEVSTLLIDETYAR